MTKKKSKKNYYVTSEQIRTELQICHLKGRITPKMTSIFVLMIDNIQSQFTYVSDEDRKDVRSHAIEKILTKWKKCDINRDNLFSFFTQVIKNDLYAGWNKLTKHRADFSYSTIFESDV